MNSARGAEAIYLVLLTAGTRRGASPIKARTASLYIP